MKRILKKSLILFALCLFSTKSVNAFEVNGSYSLSSSTTVGQYVNRINHKYKIGEDYYTTYNPIGHAAVDSSGNTYAAYCLDPGHSTDPSNSYFVSRTLMSEDNLSARDYGLLTILKHASSNSWSDSNFFITQHAVRMYIDVFLGWANPTFYNQGSQNTYPNVQAYAGAVYRAIVKDPDLQEAYVALTKGVYGNYTDIPSVFGMPGTNESTIKYFSGSDIDAAIDVLKDGVYAALSYQNGKAEVQDANLELLGVEKTDEEDTKLAIVALKLKGISSLKLSDAITIVIGSNVLNAELIGVSETYELNEDAYESKDWLTISEDEKTLYLAFRIQHVVPEEGSETINGSINVNFHLEGSNFLSGAVLHAKNETAGKNYQRFVIFTNDSSELNRNLGIPISADPEDITEEKEPCNPEYNLPPVCQDDSGEVNDDNSVTYSFKEGVVDGKSSIIACIVENTDLATNDYQLIDDRSEVVSDNAYCAVYCKEDYSFDLPYKQHVDNGRYFRIRLGIKGQQDCYLSKMNKKQFNKDVIEAQKGIVDAYNDWLKYYELANAISLNQFVGTGEYDTCYDEQCSKETDDDGKLTSCSEEEAETYKSEESKKVVFKGTYYAYTESGGSLTVAASAAKKPEDVEFNNDFTDPTLSCTKSGDTCSSTGSKECTLEDGDDAESLYKAARDEETTGYKALEKSKKKVLTAKIEKLKEIIDEYNSCMDDDDYKPISGAYENNHTWDMIYDYNPEILYSYQEPDPTSIDTPKWITEVQSLGADIMEPVKRDPDSPEPAEYIKAGECEESGEDGICQEVETVELIFGGESPVKEYCKENDLDKETYECSAGLTKPTYSNNSYFTCEISETGGVSCGSKTFKVTDISYLHKVAVAGGTYDTPRVYYSYHTDGSVVIDTDYPDIENNYDRIDGLPVGINTPYGTYLYRLTLNNIGKYYNTGELGRIYSDDSNSLVMKVKETAETSDGETVGKNEYVCTYDVPHEDVNPDKWCVIYEDKYYVCDTEVYDEDCEEKASLEEAKNDSKYHDNCSETVEKPYTYCNEHEGNYYVCTTPDYQDDDEICQLYPSREAAINASDFTYGCSEKTYCVQKGKEYYVCTQPTYDKKKCQSYGSGSEAREKARNNSEDKSGCNEHDLTYCIRKGKEYFVCTQNSYDEKACESYGTDKLAALYASDNDDGCGALYCVPHKDKYYVCLTNYYYKSTCDEADSLDDALNNSDEPGNCVPKEDETWCVKKGTEYYVCTQSTYDKKKCIGPKSLEEAQEISTYDGNCLFDDDTWCVKYGSKYYICPQEGYGDNCALAANRVTALKSSNKNYNCPVPTWCIKENDQYYICESNVYSPEKCKSTTYSEAVNKSTYDVNCVEETWCVKHDSSYYVCTQSDYDEDKCQPYYNNKEQAIKDSKYDSNCTETWCVKEGSTYYVCTQPGYDKDKCQSYENNRTLAIESSKQNYNCSEVTYCVENAGKYYSCKQNKYSEKDGDCSEPYITREEAIKNSSYPGNCVNYCIENEGSYYSCSQKEYSSDTNICKPYYDDCSSAISASYENINCKCDKQSLEYCVRTASGYYSCKEKQYDPSCIKHENRIKALESVNCNPDDEDCENDYNCRCPKCTVTCYDTCIQKPTKKPSEDVTYELLFNFNAITPAKVNINGREMGYNWDINNPKNVLIARKAANTISEIEARANVVNVSSEHEIEKVQDYDFKVTMTPAVTTWVREYNRSQLDSGSYNNDSMKCYDYEIDSGTGINSEGECKKAGYTWKENKCVMSNIFCYSEFIDELVERQPDAVDNETLTRRNNAKTASFNNYTSYKALPYTETPIVTNDYWTIYIYDKLDINGDGIPDIGPSWK